MAASTNRSESNHREKVQKVFIQRDYSEGTSVKFQTKFPPELEGLIDRHIFEQTINTLNRIYAEAEKTSTTTFCEGCLACLTSYVIYLCIETHYEKCLKRIAAYLDDQNETVWLPKGLLITDPIERGLRVIEIAILVMPRLAEGICTQLTSAVIARCKASKVFTVDDFIFQDPESLSKDICTPYKEILLIRDALLLKFAPVLRRADSLLCEALDTLAIFETGSKRINTALQGGVYTGEVTEIHGPPGSGKTQFCLDIISNLLIETSSTVLYMDSNCTFSARRVEEILVEKSDGCIVLNEKLQRIRVINMYDVYNFLDILYYVEKELQKKESIYYKNLKLVIIDSITHVLAPCFGGTFLDGGGMISIVSELFNVICSKYTLSIMVCNNTVQSNGWVIKPALGASWKHVPSVSLCIQSMNDAERRKLSAIKSCRTGLFKDVPFCIGKCGISN